MARGDGPGRRRWPALVTCLAVVVTLLGLASPGDAVPGRGARPAPTTGQAGAGVDYVVPRAPDGRAQVRKWPGRQIRYWETIPAKWDWGLRHAIAAWNGSGARIRFVRAATAGEAQLKISYGDTGGSDGRATVGYTPHAWVHLNPSYKTLSADAVNTVWVGRLFSHELGHVLGFQHTLATCSLMVAIFYMDSCPLLLQPGYYACRWIDKPLLTRFIALYGGTAHQPPASCLIDPLPPQLTGVTFGGGQAEGRAVTIQWAVPAGAPPGTHVLIRVWPAATCGGTPSWVDEYTPAPTARQWTDPVQGAGPQCYRIAAANKWGATRPPFQQVRQRWWPAPPDPVVSGVTWDASLGVFRFTAPIPANASLFEVHNFADPTVCDTAWNDGANASFLYPETDGSWTLSPSGPVTCATFFTKGANEAVSGPTSVRFEVPLPGAPTVGTPVELDSSVGQFQVSGTAAPGTYPGGEVVPGACGSGPPADASWFDLWDDGTAWDFVAEAEGVNCLYVATTDNWGRRGALVAREFTWTPPPA